MNSLDELSKKYSLSADELAWLRFIYAGKDESAAARIKRNEAEKRPIFTGMSWVQADKKLIAGVASKQSIAALASSLRRPISSLTSKLMKCELLTEADCSTFLISDGKSLDLTADAVKSLNAAFEKNERAFAEQQKSKSSSKSKKLASPVVQENVEITEEFQQVLDFVESKQEKAQGSAIFVTGVAGVGKSVLIGLISAKFESVCLCAPTGKAALAIGGATIHSTFSLGREPTIQNISSPRAALKPEKKELLANLKNIIIDEVSMCDAEILQCIDTRMRQAKGNGLPFGGCNMIFVGDLLQLPPVVTEERALVLDRYESPYFFSAPVIKSIDMPVVQLTKTFRQKDPVLARMLNNIRVGENVYETLAWFNNKAYLEKKDLPTGSDTTFLVISNKEAAEINERELAKLPGEPTLYEARRTGTFLDKKDTPSGGTAPFMLNLKVGARVIIIKNGKGYVNGDMGKVVKLAKDVVEVKLDDGRKIELERASWAEVEYQKGESGEAQPVIKGECEQFPLLLGNAITTHRAQGMSLPCATVKFPAWQKGKSYGPFNEGQVYVALSRIRSLEGLRLLNPIHPNAIKTSRVALEFYNSHNVSHQVSDVPEYKRAGKPTQPVQSTQATAHQVAATEFKAVEIESQAHNAAPSAPQSQAPAAPKPNETAPLAQASAQASKPAVQEDMGSSLDTSEPEPASGRKTITQKLSEKEAEAVAAGYPTMIAEIRRKIGLADKSDAQLANPVKQSEPQNITPVAPSPDPAKRVAQVDIQTDASASIKAVENTPAMPESDELRSAKKLEDLDRQMLDVFASIIESESTDENKHAPK